MSISISKKDSEVLVNALSDEIRNEIMMAVEESLKTQGLDSDAYQQAWDSAYNSKVCDLDERIPIEFVDEQLSYYVVENLRYQQDGTGGFKIERYDNLQEAIYAFAALPKEYTSALGASLTGGKFGVGELDLVHRKNGEPVQVNDFKFSERWDNLLVRRAVAEINRKLGVEYESDIRLFGDKSVLIPLEEWEEQNLNSYFVDKYLRPVEGAEREVAKRFGDLSAYGPTHPAHSAHLLSAVNEVFLGGTGWVSGKEFFAKLNSIDEYASPVRLKVMRLNVNYVDMNGLEGQADILPGQFRLLKQQTIERTARHPGIDEQIEEANKIRLEQMDKKGKDKSKDKDRDPDDR